MIFICQNSAFRVKTIHWKKKMSLNFDFCTSLCFNMLTFHCVLLQESLNQGIYNDFNCLHKTLLVSMVPILCSFPEFFQRIFVSGDVAPKSLPCILPAAALENCWHPTSWCLTWVWRLKLYLLLSPHAENSEHLTGQHEDYRAVLSFLLVILPQNAWDVNQFNLLS